MLLQFAHLVRTAFRFFLLALVLALGFVALFLLPGLFLLALGKCGSASWHSQSPLSLLSLSLAGNRLLAAKVQRSRKATSEARGVGVPGRDSRRAPPVPLPRQPNAV